MKNKTIPKFGDVYYAELKQDGHIQGGIRPVIIAQNNIGNQYSPIVNIIPMTSKIDKRKFPMHVCIEDVQGIMRKSIALVEQMRPINKEDLKGEKIAALGDAELRSIGKAIQEQYPFPT